MKKARQQNMYGIAAIRRDLGYSQTHLAQLLEIPRSCLSMAEAGVRNIPSTALLKLADMEKERLAQAAPPLVTAHVDKSVAPAAYDLEKLSKAECEEMLEQFKMERAQLDFSGATLAFKLDQAVSISTELGAQLLHNQAELAALDKLVKELPPGSNHEDVKRNIARLEHRNLQLEQRHRRYSATVQLDQLYNIACIKAAMHEVDMLLPLLSNRLALLTQ